MCSRHWSFTAFLFRVLLTFIVMPSTASQAIEQSTSVAQGVEVSTPPVKGRAPTAEISVDNTKPEVGNEITVTSIFKDEDGDAVFGTYQWMLDDANIVGAKSNKYKLKLDDIQAGSKLNVSVTPKTNPIFTDPSQGEPVSLVTPINIRWKKKILSITPHFDGVVADGKEDNIYTIKATYLDDKTPAVGTISWYNFYPNQVVHYSSGTWAITEEDGTLTLLNRSLVAGAHKVKICIDNNCQIATLNFFAGDLDLGKSTFIALPTNVPANGTDTSTLTFTPKDKNENPLTGLTNVTFQVEDLTNTTLSPVTETQTNSGIYTATLTGTILGTAAVKPLVNSVAVGTLSDKVIFTPHRMNSVLVNGVEFAVDQGFPTTGFTGAEFTLKVPGAASDYTWSSSANWATVDSSGKVSFTKPGHSSHVTIRATPNAGGLTFDYTFKVKNWFTNSENVMTWSQASNYCSSTQLKQPKRSDLTNMPAERKPGINSLWPEWGSLENYTRSSFLDTEYWSSDTSTVHGYNYTTNLQSGGTKTRGSSIEVSAVCMREESLLLPSTAQIVSNGFVVNTGAVANGQNSNDLSATVKDDNGHAVPNVAVTFAVITGQATLQSQVVRTDVNGVATAKLVSLVAGDNTVTATVGNNTTDPKASTFVAVTLDLAKSSFTVSEDKITAGGTTTSTLTFTPKEANNNNPLTGLTNVKFELQTGNVVGATLSDVTEVQVTEKQPINGMYTATLTAGTKAGAVTFKPKIGNTVVDKSATVTFIADSNTAQIADVDFTVATGALANGSATNAMSATVKDANGNAVPNVDVTFAVTTGDATPRSQMVQTDADGVATATLVSLVAGDNAVTATVGSNTATAKTSSFVVVPAITGVSVNGATFAVDKGFPTTGFTGAHFTLTVAGAPSDYTWSSSASWAPVDTTGKVSFTSQGNSSPVTIWAEPKAGGTALTYTFTVKSWFSHHGVKPERFSYAMKHCTNRENHVMPVINEMIFSDAPTKRVAGSNKLLSEWGSPGSYSTSEFKIKTAYWLSDPRSGGERLTINPDTGAIRVESVSGWNGFAMCRQELKPLY
jgi:adhesin/invasin